MLAPQLDRFAAARQVAPDGPSDIDRLAAPGRHAPATEAITDGAGEALGNPLGLHPLFWGDECAQIGPGERIIPAYDQPTGAAPVRANSIPLRMFGPAHCRACLFARQHLVPDHGSGTSVPNTSLGGLGGGDGPEATTEPEGIEEIVEMGPLIPIPRQKGLEPEADRGDVREFLGREDRQHELGLRWSDSEPVASQSCGSRGRRRSPANSPCGPRPI